MELMNQPFNGQLGDRLIELLESSEFHTLDIAVAFAKNSGVLRIKDPLQKFREAGGKVNVYVGVDLGGTSYEALTALRLHTDSLNVVHSEGGQTFHSKIYQFSGKDKGLIVVGSHNLTGGGLWTNFESSIHIPVDCSNANEKLKLAKLYDYIGELTSLKDSVMSISGQDDIDKLLQNEYIFKEVAERVRLRLAKAKTQDEALERLFGNGASAKLPSVAMPKKKNTATVSSPADKSTSVLLRNDGETIWFETRRMTGGSGNILDLSKESLVELGDPSGTRFDLGTEVLMRGSVWFFDIDPTDILQSKDVTINFDGIDYFGNKVLYPEGKKANGTWRLQIRGTSSTGKKITEAMKEKGEGLYLVEKLVSFTKIEGDYYFMSVTPEAELESFKAASTILARNGSSTTAKLIGLL